MSMKELVLLGELIEAKSNLANLFEEDSTKKAKAKARHFDVSETESTSTFFFSLKTGESFSVEPNKTEIKYGYNPNIQKAGKNLIKITQDKEIGSIESDKQLFKAIELAGGMI